MSEAITRESFFEDEGGVIVFGNTFLKEWERASLPKKSL
jgi:hypothetical protein